MNLRNYTSSVPMNDSIARIEQMLVEAGANHIAKSYEKERVVGILFQLMINGNPLTFKLPAKVEPVYKSLIKLRRKKTPAIEKGVMAQAERTAWKLVYDWVSVQLAMIQLEQAEAAEVFFPYLWNPATSQTYFAMLKEKEFDVKQLGM